jgi:mono/diheme cytochrome c family protein
MEAGMKVLILALSTVFAAEAAQAEVRSDQGRSAEIQSAQIRSAQENAGLIRQGEEIVTKECGRCHAIGRTGASKHPQAPPFRTLSKHYPIESLEEALGEGIISGHPDMPEFEFDADDVGAIIAYLKSIQVKD